MRYVRLASLLLTRARKPDALRRTVHLRRMLICRQRRTRRHSGKLLGSQPCHRELACARAPTGACVSHDATAPHRLRRAGESVVACMPMSAVSVGRCQLSGGDVAWRSTSRRWPVGCAQRLNRRLPPKAQHQCFGLGRLRPGSPARSLIPVRTSRRRAWPRQQIDCSHMHATRVAHSPASEN